jgi:formylglycine-generating enzyme required for sulfatase activity
MNDLQARDQWVAVFKQTARFYNEHPPYELIFDPSLEQEGETDYGKRTATLTMRVGLLPSEAGFAALNALLEGLEQTGRRGTWGFAGWPMEELNPKVSGTRLFSGRNTTSFAVEVLLLNDKQKPVGKGSITLSAAPGITGGNKSVTLPQERFDTIRFQNVKADELSPVLTIVINSVNGIPSKTLNSTGYMRIAPGDVVVLKAQAEAERINRQGNAYYAQKEYDLAVKNYAEAVRLGPDNPLYTENLAKAKAAAEQAAAERKVKAEAANKRGDEYYDKKDYSQAIDEYAGAIGLDPNNAVYFNNRGAAYRNNGNNSRAVPDFTDAVRLDPNNARYKENLEKARAAAEAKAAASLKAANMVKINGGTFTMGSPVNEAERGNNEVQHQVTVNGFYMGKYEVTQKEWREVMGNNPSRFQGDNLPVEQVSWYNAVEYCNERSQREGLTPAYTINGTNVRWDRNANGYRLPTEAEWEYACRAGTSGPFSTGNNITTSQANYDGNKPYNNNAKGSYREKTVNVGSFGSNAWGLYDMHGNVWEWCWDWYGDYPSGTQTNPADTSTGTDRVFRGGSWSNYARYLRSAHRVSYAPTYRNGYLGFRLVRP